MKEELKEFPKNLLDWEDTTLQPPGGIAWKSRQILKQCPHCLLIGEKNDIKVKKPQQCPGLLPLLCNDVPWPDVHYHPHQDECGECWVGECRNCHHLIV